MIQTTEIVTNYDKIKKEDRERINSMQKLD